MIKRLTEITQHTLIRVVFAITFFALTGASLVFFFEGSVNEEFKVMGDSIWWVLVTMTTVGYGDKVPITIGGRIIGIIIMFFGLALLSSFTATISSFFIAKKIKEGRGLEEIKLKNHLIICGWNFSAEQILSRLEKNKKKAGSVVLINQLNEENIADIIHRFASIKAIRNCTLAVIQKKELLKNLDKDPIIAAIIYKNISAELCKRLIKSNKDILKLTTAFSLALEGD